MPRTTNIKLYELEVAACLAWSFIQIREREGLPFHAPFISITMVGSLTQKERGATGSAPEDFIHHATRHFEERGIDFSLGFSNEDILDFQMKRVASLQEIASRIEKDQAEYIGSNAVLGYYLKDWSTEELPRIQIDSTKVRDVVICGFNKSRDGFTWCSLRDKCIFKAVPPWLVLDDIGRQETSSK